MNMLDADEIRDDKDPAYLARVGERARHALGVGVLAKRNGRLVIDGLRLDCQNKPCPRSILGYAILSAGWSVFVPTDTTVKKGPRCDLRNEGYVCPPHQKQRKQEQEKHA